jgi:peptide/histidine transporter 3/4
MIKTHNDLNKMNRINKRILNNNEQEDTDEENVNEQTRLLSSRTVRSSKQQASELYAIQLLNRIDDSRTRFQQNLSFVLLLVVNTLERFTFYGLICNFILYLNKDPLTWESYNASLILLIFLGITHVSSVIGGWIADAFLGKFPTLFLSFIIYIIGYIPYPLIAYDPNKLPVFCDSNCSLNQMLNLTFAYTEIHYDKHYNNTMSERSIANESCSWIIITSCILTGVGVGFTRANLGPFGADQVRILIFKFFEQTRRLYFKKVISMGQTMLFKYFNWLYWCTNLGSLFSFAVLAYIQQNISFFIGFMIPFVSLVLSFLVFVAGSTLFHLM